MKAILFLVLALACQIVIAQGGRKPAEFVDSYNDRFLDQMPFLDSIVADVTAWDAEGKPFELNSTRGKHTVLVFGCLT